MQRCLLEGSRRSHPVLKIFREFRLIFPAFPKLIQRLLEHFPFIFEDFLNIFKVFSGKIEFLNHFRIFKDVAKILELFWNTCANFPNPFAYLQS